MPCLGWQPQENTHQNHVLLPHRRAGQGEMGSWVCCSLLPSLSWMCGTMMANTAAAFKAFQSCCLQECCSFLVLATELEGA